MVWSLPRSLGTGRREPWEQGWVWSLLFSYVPGNQRIRRNLSDNMELHVQLRKLKTAHNTFSAKREKCRDLLSKKISCVSILVSNHLPQPPQSPCILGGCFTRQRFNCCTLQRYCGRVLFEWSPLYYFCHRLLSENFITCFSNVL